MRSIGVVLAELVCVSTWAQQLPGIAARSGNFVVRDPAGEPSSAVIATNENATGLVPISFRQGRGGFFAHQWLEVQTSHGEVTLGYGSALLPMIDRGQITVEDARGREEHEFLFRAMPLYLDFGRPPGAGYDIAPTVYVPVARADEIVEQQRHRRFIFPYIPLLHDCRTYVCAMQASIEGKSKLPCYLLFEGYW
jgi:hypothetical protein